MPWESVEVDLTTLATMLFPDTVQDVDNTSVASCDGVWVCGCVGRRGGGHTIGETQMVGAKLRGTFKDFINGLKVSAGCDG